MLKREVYHYVAVAVAASLDSVKHIIGIPVWSSCIHHISASWWAVHHHDFSIGAVVAVAFCPFFELFVAFFAFFFRPLLAFFATIVSVVVLIVVVSVGCTHWSCESHRQNGA